MSGHSCRHADSSLATNRLVLCIPILTVTLSVSSWNGTEKNGSAVFAPCAIASSREWPVSPFSASSAGQHEINQRPAAATDPL